MSLARMHDDMWPHERLVAYQKARETLQLLDEIASRIPSSRPDLRSQLQRASTSILFNIAEGANEFSLGDKARFYRMARRSAGECDAVLDALACLGLANEAHANARAKLREVGLLLSALIHHPPPR